MKKALLLLSLLVLPLLAACSRQAPAETPAPTEAPYPYAPPKLTLAAGEEETAAILGQTSWIYRTEAGEEIPYGGDSASVDDYRDRDWYALGTPILLAEGEVRFSFDGPEPETCRLWAFTSQVLLPMDLEVGTFTPYAGVNSYALVCTWDSRPEGGSGACTYILLIQGAETNAPEMKTETEELALAVTSADAYGCVFTLENRCTEVNRRFEYAMENDYSLLRRTPAGGWEWVKPIRRNLDTYSAALKWGHSYTDAWDWSYAYGPLPPGEYRLRIWGNLGRGSAADFVSVGGSFTLEDVEPVGPGPSTLCPCPRWLEVSLYSREQNGSGHRWMQTLTPKTEGWAAERDFSLFRVTGEGELEYIPPEYDLPGYLNWTPVLKPGKTVSFEVELAARYGELKKGRYVLRRRLIRLTEEELKNVTLMVPDRRLLPEDRVQYVDTEFTLYTLRDVPQAVDPMDELRDCSNLSSGVLVTTAGSTFSSAGCTLRLKNADANQWYDVFYESDYYYLYFNHKLEWFPAAHTRYGAHGLIWKTLAPGETQELNINFSHYFGELPPGSYRLVIACQALPYDGEPEKTDSFITVPFRILEDGSGVLEEAEEAKQLVFLYINGGLGNRDGWIVRVKASAWRWDLKEQEDRLRLTVWRDRDLERAQALLGDYGCVDILRGEDPALKPSPVTEENLGSRGTLSITPYPDIYSLWVQEPDQPPVLWVYSFTFAGEGSGTQTLNVDAYFHIEVLEGDRWLSMSTTMDQSTVELFERVYQIQGRPGGTVSFGMNNSRLMNLSLVYGEFDPAKEYRVVLQMWEDPQNKEYYTCPLPLWG